MFKFVACLLLLLLLQPTLGLTNAVKFDLHSNQCVRKSWFKCTRRLHDWSGCIFWAKNGDSLGRALWGLKGKQAGLQLNGQVSQREYTYVWTTCRDDLWIDAMTVFDDRNRPRSFGANNNQGWCLSYDTEVQRWMKPYVPAKRCFQMLRLGRGTDRRVWGYGSHFNKGRRALTEADIQEVRDCENSATDVTKECKHLVEKFFKAVESEDAEWDFVQPIEKTAEFFERFDKTEDGEVKRAVMIPILMEVSNGDRSDSEKLFDKADMNENGSLDFQEFKEMLGFEDGLVNMYHFQELLEIANAKGLKKLYHQQ